jgi:hypothetical protein
MYDEEDEVVQCEREKKRKRERNVLLLNPPPESRSRIHVEPPPHAEGEILTWSQTQHAAEALKFGTCQCLGEYVGGVIFAGDTNDVGDVFVGKVTDCMITDAEVFHVGMV